MQSVNMETIAKDLTIILRSSTIQHVHVDEQIIRNMREPAIAVVPVTLSHRIGSLEVVILVSWKQLVQLILQDMSQKK